MVAVIQHTKYINRNKVITLKAPVVMEMVLPKNRVPVCCSVVKFLDNKSFLAGRLDAKILGIKTAEHYL